MTTLRLIPGSPPAVLSALRGVLDGSGEPFAPLPADPALAERVRRVARADVPLESGAVMLPTSGSSGEPKGVLLSREALIASATATHARLGGPGQWLLMMPAYFVGGLQVLTRSLLAGVDPVIADGADFAEQAGAMTGEQRYTSMVPTQLARLLETDVPALRSFDAILIGAAATSNELRAKAEAAGVKVVTTYGMTETGGGCVYDGRPLDGVTVDLDNDRVVLGGPTLFDGYRLEPGLTAQALDGKKFRTQDRGRCTEDGRLEILGRIDDVVISGGVNVVLPSVQQRLLTHAGITDAVVLGVPDEEWGSRVVAFVIGTAGLDELRDHVAAQLPRTWAPRELIRLEELPMLASGKVDRQRLLELAQ
ncbi:o-succinylbenzoate--CoA ligase [Kribbella deserti]|uniref:O-succinylbenzoate--CoA ligase n=1 Tax=Kribbella deserti TaxID=1926257 RepID=A0ABV6QVC5_9ACTN